MSVSFSLNVKDLRYFHLQLSQRHKRMIQRSEKSVNVMFWCQPLSIKEPSYLSALVSLFACNSSVNLSQKQTLRWNLPSTGASIEHPQLRYWSFFGVIYNSICPFFFLFTQLDIGYKALIHLPLCLAWLLKVIFLLFQKWDEVLNVLEVFILEVSFHTLFCNSS